MEYKRDNHSKDNVYPFSFDLLYGTIERTNKMAEVKFGLILLHIIGVPLSVLAFIVNFNTWQGNTIFVFMSIYWVGLIFFRFRSKIRAEKKERSEQRIRDLEEKNKQLDYQERVNRLNGKTK